MYINTVQFSEARWFRRLVDNEQNVNGFKDPRHALTIYKDEYCLLIVWFSMYFSSSYALVFDSEAARFGSCRRQTVFDFVEKIKKSIKNQD